MAETSIFGFNPQVSHFFNILFFALTVVLLFFFLQKFLKNNNRAIIIAATLLFAFHPIHTEVVANIKSRDEILGLLFGLISFYCILLYHEKNKVSYYIISITAFLMAIFCKENCLTFVIIIPMLLYFFTTLDFKKIAIKSIPYFVAVGFYLFIRSRVLQSMTFSGEIPVMFNSLMAADTTADRIATSFVLLGKYIYMTIIPYPLSYDYSYKQIPNVSWGNVEPILSVLVCVVLIVIMILGFRKKSIYSFSIALFFITLFLSSNLVVKISWTFAERFLYTPSLAFCIVLPVLTAKALKYDPVQLVWKKNINFYILIACILIIYTFIVIPRNAIWKNDFTLFKSGVVTSPNSERTHAALGDKYIDSALNTNDPAKKPVFYSLAFHELTRTAEIYDKDADCYNNLAACYYNRGNIDSAIIAYKMALKINPKFHVASDNLGIIYLNKALYDSAVPYLIMSYKADTNDLDDLLKVGTAYENEMKYNHAFHYDSMVIKKDPANKQTPIIFTRLYNEEAMQYLNSNKLDSALLEFQTALKRDSNSANTIGYMGIIYQKKGDIEIAKRFYQKALSLDPRNQLFANYLQSLGHK
jgi:tetratricopeptide (TPR) repeat protein